MIYQHSKEKKEMDKGRKEKGIRSPRTKLELLHPLGFKNDLWSLV
jgi:hypothetical protein